MDMNHSREFIEAHLALHGWEPVRQSFEDRLLHPGYRKIVRTTSTGKKFYAVMERIGDHAAIHPSEYCCILDNQLEAMFDLIWEMENVTEDNG